MSDRSFIVSSVAATGAVLATLLSGATLISSQSTAQGQASSEVKLGNLVTVEDWTYNGSGFAGGSCTIDGTAKYKVEGPKTLTGEVYGKVQIVRCEIVLKLVLFRIKINS
mgnify:CR=1 FL=1